jgi:hypothetical protein
VDEDRPKLERREPRRAERAPGDDGPTGFEPLQHSPFTVEGEIETLGRLAQGLRGRTDNPRQQRAARMFVLPIVAVLVLCVVLVVLSFL